MKTEELVIAIIKEQSQVIGDSLSQHMAMSSGVVKFNSSKIEDITLMVQDHEVVINKLVMAYKSLFGDASVAVCNRVIKRFTK